MDKYYREKGQKEVYTKENDKWRHVKFAEAKEKNIWKKIIPVKFGFFTRYGRQEGSNKVYEFKPGMSPRYISFTEAKTKNLWAQIKDVKNLQGWERDIKWGVRVQPKKEKIRKDFKKKLAYKFRKENEEKKESKIKLGILPKVSITIERLTNKTRLDNNLELLKVNPLLKKAAQQKAEDMAKKGYFSHTSPSGMKHHSWIDNAGYKYMVVGENLASNFVDSKDAIDSWMKSSTHKANILSKNFSEIGIGVAKGIYKEKETIFIVQFFGRPKQ